jgi:hypothetical protein
MPRLRPTWNRHTPPRRALPAEPDRGDRSIDPHTAPQVTSVALLALTHAIAAVIGWVLGYLLARPPRRRSSIELGIAGATRRIRGRHRR